MSFSFTRGTSDVHLLFSKNSFNRSDHRAVGSTTDERGSLNRDILQLSSSQPAHAYSRLGKMNTFYGLNLISLPICVFTLCSVFLPTCSGSLTSQTEHTCRGNPASLVVDTVSDLVESSVEQIPTPDLSPSRDKMYPLIEEPSEGKLPSRLPPQENKPPDHNLSSTRQGKGKVAFSKEETMQVEYKDGMRRSPDGDRRRPPRKYSAQRQAVLAESTKPSIMVKSEKRLAETDLDTPHPKRLASHENETRNVISPEFFDVYDWDFVRESPRDPLDTNSDQTSLHKDELEEFLERIKFKRWYNFLYIDRSDLGAVMKEFPKQRYRLFARIPTRSKTQIVYDLLWKLSDEKLALDKNKKFKNLISHLASRVVARNQSVKLAHKAVDLSSPSIIKIIEYLESVNKVTIFLMIIHLSIFHEHAPEGLNEELIDKLTSFLENLWEKIVVPDQKFLNQNPFAEKNSLFFPTENKDRGNGMKNLLYLKEERYHMAWNFVEQWAKENGKSLKWGTSRFPRTDKRFLVEIVNYILLYSNPSFVSKMLMMTN
ncbi:hypothetical protein Pst134EA_011624 [Puccinia striiformis f. sp. tritici]|uniref:hypothetical protein n=1 Tax=Puccinia striiformis f. sp. tritici TaxID=168172 RepID=UPI002007D351|nr:hypothetical protein Pst134EA_011624 [Puccinia striiformis f. sp. tritici]KAH9468002.1 hypothetical protein Pst134EA_011624 [Puccinia striiformis f. sp. tritici]